MNFLYFAYGIGVLAAMNFILFILTLLGAQIFEKQFLENLIHPLFFIGLILIGFMIARKAAVQASANPYLLSLMLVMVMGGFIFISGIVPAGFNLFLIGSFVALIVGSSAFQLYQRQKLKSDYSNQDHSTQTLSTHDKSKT